MKAGHFTGKCGFTFVEIMIVVTIIGLLAALAIPAFSSARSKSRASVCNQNRRIIFEQLNIYCLESGIELTPANFPDLCATRDALAPGGSYKYVRDWKIFECPIADVQDQHDYTYIWENDDLVDIVCNNSSADIRNLHNLR